VSGLGTEPPAKQRKSHHAATRPFPMGSLATRCTGRAESPSGDMSMVDFARQVLGVNLTAKEAPLLYVFDFDQTILKIHSFGSHIRAKDVASRDLEADTADIEFFRTFIDTMTSAGIPVAVASFGEYEVIQNYLDRLTPGVFNRSNICTPSCVGYKDGYSVPAGKNTMLELLLKTMICNDGKAITTEMRKRTILFDDQQSNIEKAASSGFSPCFTPYAFTRDAWPQIQKGLGHLVGFVTHIASPLS